MRGKKMLAAGLMAGILLSMTVQSFGEPLIRLVQAKINPDYHITFNGEKKDLPDGYDILVYQDRTYVPARYVAEELGATVKWHEDTKEIEIIKPEAAAPCPTSGAINPPDSTTYSKLPQNKSAENFRIAVTAYVKENTDKNTGNKLALSITNTSNDPIVLDQTSTKFIVDGKTYQVSPDKYHEMDTIWYKNIDKDMTQVGNILMPSEIKDATKLHVDLVVKSNGAFPEWSQTIPFDIDLT